MIPFAPGLLSTMTVCFNELVMCSASIRPTTSAPEPGACGITSLMGRVGNSCAAAKLKKEAEVSQRKEAIRLRRTFSMVIIQSGE